MSEQHVDDPRMMSRRKLLYLGGGLAFVLGGPGAALTRAQRAWAAELATRPLQVGVTGAPGSFDFDYTANSVTSLMIVKNIYPNMLDFGVRTLHGAEVSDPVHFVRSYAQSWTPTANGKLVTLKVKKGLKFPSGNPITAHDFKWSKDRAFVAKANVAGVYRLIDITKPADVELVDDYTIRFHQSGSRSLSTQLHLLCDFFFDSKLVQQHATKSDPWATSWVAKTPQAGGPYMASSYTPGQALNLVANPYYPGPVKPHIKNVTLQFIPSVSNLQLELEKGNLDMAIGLPPRQVESMKSVKGVRIISSPGSEYWAINMLVTQPPFNNRLVRQAMAYAVPYDAILKNVFFGEARRSNSPVPLDMPGNSPVGYPYTENVAKAKALLQQAGKANGFSSELVVEAGDAQAQQIATFVSGGLKRIGINLQVTELDPAALNQRRNKNNIPMQVTYSGASINDFEYWLGISATKGAFLNYSNYINPKIEAIFKEIHSTLGSAARNRLAYRAQQIMAEDVPMLLVGQPNFLHPVRSNVSGYVQDIDTFGTRFYYLRES